MVRNISTRRILARKLIGKLQSLRTRAIWKDNIQMDVKKKSCEERRGKEQAQDSYCPVAIFGISDAFLP
jgi:hypothetical protein